MKTPETQPNPVITQDILAQHPIHPKVADILIREHGISPETLDLTSKWATDNIHTLSENLGRVLELSSDISMHPVVGMHEQPDDTVVREQASEYELATRHDPVKKLESDRKTVDYFIRSLGATNPLHVIAGEGKARKERFDAAFDLANLRRLLERDYEDLPESKKRPELRMTEARIAEEMALLWSTKQVGRATMLPENRRALLMDVDDWTLFPPEEARHQREQANTIGSALANEAADLFEAVSKSPTVDITTQLEAYCRMTDMRLRGLAIELDGVQGSRARNIRKRMQAASDGYLTNMFEIWEKGLADGHIEKGKLYELLAVAQERDQRYRAGNYNEMVRLALPREDETRSKSTFVSYTTGMLAKLSADVIVETPDGTTLTARQVKLSEKHQGSAPGVVYHDGKLVFYPRSVGGIINPASLPKPRVDSPHLPQQHRGRERAGRQ